MLNHWSVLVQYMKQCRFFVLRILVRGSDSHDNNFCVAPCYLKSRASSFFLFPDRCLWFRSCSPGHESRLKARGENEFWRLVYFNQHHPQTGRYQATTQRKTGLVVGTMLNKYASHIAAGEYKKKETQLFVFENKIHKNCLQLRNKTRTKICKIYETRMGIVEKSSALAMP
jgi:hypothetical protein